MAVSFITYPPPHILLVTVCVVVGFDGMLLFNLVYYVFLILCLCILIVMYVPFCILFHCVVLCIVCV
jgi:hypothetical protein